jgi:KUP system potassium uptake protein
MAPAWALYPLVVLATGAAAIASQAVITGAFSLTMQAIRLGYVSRLRVEHTSSEQIGQIYIPTINWALMLASIGLVLGFQSSSNLAAAYGVAITLTMAITTVLFFLLLVQKWNWNLWAAASVAGFFLLIELSFLGANLPKIAHGGWFPLLIAAIGFVLMSTWRDGRRLLASRLRQQLIPLDLFVADLLGNPPLRVPGTAIFMFSNPVGTPHALRHNVRHNKILHETVVILCVDTAEIPHVPWSERVTVEEIGEGFHGVKLTYGFMEEPDVPRDLRRVRHPQLNFQGTDISYFLGRETLLVSRRPGMARWRERLFTWMSRNAQTATAYFHIPPDRVFEVGVQVEL